MRVIVMIKANQDSEAGKLPSERMLTEMMKFNQELAKAGIMLAGEGLQPSSKAKRVRFSPNGTRRVTDGPFTETKELLAGYWVWQVKSMDEAVEWVKRIPCPDPDQPESDVEIRPLFEIEDFGDNATPEVREREAQLRQEIEQRTR